MSMICRFYGKKLSIDFLEKHCRPSKEGVSLKSIADLCEFLNIEYTAGRVSLDDLGDCPLPCILHWNQNHFVVLYKIGGNGKRFYIADPAKGKYGLRADEFKDHMNDTPSFDKIELRSEKVRKILGEVPNGPVRWGIAVICIIFAVLMIVLMCVQFPYGEGETIFEHITGRY